MCAMRISAATATGDYGGANRQLRLIGIIDRLSALITGGVC